MDYTGGKVFHKSKFGEGVIVSQDDTGLITVKFDKEPGLKQFRVPGCFKQFLELQNIEMATHAYEANRKIEIEEKEAAEKEQKKVQEKNFARKLETMHEKRKYKTIYIPKFKSNDDFFNYQERLLSSEITYLKNNGGKRTKIIDGKLIENKNGKYIYSFESDSELNLPDNTQIYLWTQKDQTPATVISCEDFTIIIATSKNLGETIPNIEFSAEPWKLIQYLIDRLKWIRENCSDMASSIICDGRKKVHYTQNIKKGQETACRMSISQPITFIWGPPGTGKTETLANIAHEHLNKGYRVLMLSYSNVSVDGAIWRVFKKDNKKTPGKLVRYGYPKDKNLLQHEYLTSYNLTLKKHPELMDEKIRLAEEKIHTSRTTARYIEIGQRLTKIKDLMKAEEKKAVQEAQFVATTVSKAIADKLLYEDKYDTVIFDEASMAYISQIVFSAGLADKHFICMGDFAQLPPIVQSDNSNSLNADIFKYCGITDAVEAGFGHEWLCMLDTQYRMHPQIADFSSRTMYHKLLKSGNDMQSKRKTIVAYKPFSGDVLHLVDLSGMLSVCTKTADQSRINVLSAFTAIGLAINAAKQSEVGIITPYNAQSRLLHAMSRDVAEQAPQMNKITCATVHQFQGSEKDMIIYDAVDCYRMTHPGTLLTSTTNNYANRLYNVAVTRAKGKMISIANVDYMKTKNLSTNLIFRKMINELNEKRAVSYGDNLISAVGNNIMPMFGKEKAGELFLQDILTAQKEINIDIPGGTSGASDWFGNLSTILEKAKKKGVKVFVRTDNKKSIPQQIRPFVIENKYISNPIVLIDKSIVWYGMPFSDANFVTEGEILFTQHKPIFRFEGKNTARALYGFLEMNKTIDTFESFDETYDENRYSTFASYVLGEIKCSACGGKMKLKKGRSGKFFLGCSAYPKCSNTSLVTTDNVHDYFYYKNKLGKLCLQDHTLLEAKLGRYGVYVCCNGRVGHTYKLDEI